MAALETHILVMGAVQMFGPVNGYQIRRELLSWGVDRWASIKPGSIYNTLNTLTNQGYLLRTEVIDQGRPVAVYELTDSGLGQLVDLMRTAIITVHPLSDVAFSTATNLAPLVSRTSMIDWLEQRLTALRAALENPSVSVENPHQPPWVSYFATVAALKGQREVEWLASVIADLKTGSGEGFFLGETPQWRPPPDDAAWDMMKERSRYLGLLDTQRK